MAQKEKYDMPKKAKAKSEVEEPAMVEVKKSLCNHENKHAFNEEGKLAPLFCDLPNGHQGDHHAKFTQRLQVVDEYDEKGRVRKSHFEDNEQDAHWNDAAGIPAAEIEENNIEQLTDYQRDLIMEVMRKNPSLNARQAKAAAKESELWDAGRLS